jgi:hypothetical protein
MYFVYGFCKLNNYHKLRQLELKVEQQEVKFKVVMHIYIARVNDILHRKSSNNTRVQT